ncbi:unnamed protein product [Chondrus crispus]|uniref:Uncharacterized protein n=1 Tax=Chondrus crispus TaxID=2769 RepID=R7QLD4_CHOCR|nr:unnamed protein product [Chondrus crispus]CDF38894.1 unnamed protein product [Chondrus crispus]|eukprot:XP_005718799.1 unnamed protein product [Chondrus crispus]
MARMVRRMVVVCVLRPKRYRGCQNSHKTHMQQVWRSCDFCRRR